MRYTMLFPLVLIGTPVLADVPTPLPNPAIHATKASVSPMMSLAQTSAGMIAVGNRGHVLYSSSVKGEWQQAKVPVSTMLTRVVMVNDNQGWALGHDATILRTDDGGASWQLQQWLPEVEIPLLDAHFFDVDNGIAVGAYGQLFRTADGGKHWQFEFLDSLLIEDDRLYLEEIRAESEEDYLAERAAMLPHINGITQLKDGSLFIVGEMGLMARSSDQGRTWTRLPEIYFGSLLDMVETQGGDWVAFGLRGNVFQSTDQGQSWYPLEVDTLSTFNGGRVMSDGSVILVANGGILARREKDSDDFVVHQVAKGQDLVDVVEGKPGQYWVVGSHGVQDITLKQ